MEKGAVFLLAASAAGMNGALGVENALTYLKAITAVLAVLCAVMIICKCAAVRKKKAGIRTAVVVLSCIALALSAGMTLYAGFLSRPDDNVQVFVPIGSIPSVQETEPAVLGTETQAPTEPPVVFALAMADSTNPENFGIKWEILVNDQVVESYARPEAISFGDAADYFALPGIATFLGNNYRNSATYGTASVSEGKLTKVWSHGIGKLDDWGGCAWTGKWAGGLGNLNPQLRMEFPCGLLHRRRQGIHRLRQRFRQDSSGGRRNR